MTGRYPVSLAAAGNPELSRGLAQRPPPGATASATFPATDPAARPRSRAEALAIASAARETRIRAGVSSAIAVSIMPAIPAGVANGGGRITITIGGR